MGLASRWASESESLLTHTTAGLGLVAARGFLVAGFLKMPAAAGTRDS